MQTTTNTTATRFSWANVEFQLIKTPTGAILGRLYSADAPIPVSPNTKREIIACQWGGRVLLFKSTLDDYRKVETMCAKSNMAPNRVRTTQLFQRLEAMVKRPCTPIESTAWVDEESEEAVLTISPETPQLEPLRSAAVELGWAVTPRAIHVEPYQSWWIDEQDAKMTVARLDAERWDSWKSELAEAKSADLKMICRAYGLSTKGRRKSELYERILALGAIFLAPLS